MPRINSISATPLPDFASSGEREGSRLQAIRDAYMLDTSAGQLTMMSATANAFGVAMSPMARRVQQGYSPFDEDLTGYTDFLHEFETSTSPEETMMIKQMIDNNIDLRRNLEDYPGWRFATGLLDPINLIPVPFAIGKGFAEGAKIALKRGMPIVAGTELIRHNIDPTSTAEETLFATVGGSLFMGLLGGAVGKVPKNTPLVSDVLNKLIPPQGTTSMFAGVPWHMGTQGGVFTRMTNALRSAVSYGDPAWKQVDPDTMKLSVEEFGAGGVERIVTVKHADGHEILTGVVRDGNLEIAIEVPRELRRQGLASYAIRQAVQYAEENGLRIASHGTLSPDAIHVWKHFETLGAKVEENPNYRVETDGVRKSTDGQPLLMVRQVVDPDAKQVPKHIREELEDYEKSLANLQAEIRLTEKAIKEARQKVKDAPKAGGARTKATNELEALMDTLDGKNGIRWQEEILRSQLADRNIAVAQMLDEATIKDWDLLPTGYNTILGKLDQFPWWSLMKTPLRELAPDLAVKYQMFALKMASTPGLNNKGNRLKHTTGPSVEALSVEYTGKWIVATRKAQQIYRKYAGYGESSSQVKHFVIDQAQRVRSRSNQILGGEKVRTTSDGKLTIAEFEDQISIAIANDGTHAISEVAEAAAEYIRVLKEIGEDGRELGVFASQRNIARRIEKVDEQLAEFEAKYKGKYNERTMPPGLQNQKDNLLLERVQLEELAATYKDASNTKYIHRMWIAEEVKLREDELKALLTEEFKNNPKRIIRDSEGNIVREHPDVIQGRVNEAYASILRDAETGGDLRYAPRDEGKRPWLEARKEYLKDNPDNLPRRTVKTQLKIIDRKLARIEQGNGGMGSSGPLVARRLDLDDKYLLETGFIEANVNQWMNHYVMRTAPIIETARKFGDGRAQKHIDDLVSEVRERARLETDPVKRRRLEKEADRGEMSMNELRDIVHGVYQIPDNPDAVTPRLLRMLRNFNILGAMGRSVMMAMGDIGNVVVSQGFIRSLGHSIEHFASGITDGKIKMMRDEVDLAGSVSEVILGMRYHQMTDFGAAVGTSLKHPRLSRFERGLANASQRFFLYNLLGPWTDMARRFSGGMLQSRLIENSLLWKAGNLSDDEITIMGRLGISKQQAIQFADEWERSGSLKHKKMFIANTEEWISDQAKRTFRAAMNTEIGRMVPTPGAVDKPKALLKSEWWKVIGQYRGFSIAATHRIMGAGLHTKGAQKYSGLASMVGIAMMVDAFKRPDYIQMPIEQQVLRAVELSAVTGIILDLNDTIERASAGTIGLRPLIGMDIRERNPNWANRIGTIGAVPNQWLTLMYGLTSDEAETDDLARAIRYMIPYNNLLWWNEAFNRAQRASVDFVEDQQ